MKAGILIPVLTSKDAVGADALAMADILRESGIDTRIFCISSADVHDKTWPADRLVDFAASESDLVIYHYSTGWPAALDLLRRCKGFRVVKYHNITPASFFRGFSADYEEACARGRSEIASVAALGCELYLGDSRFNLDELIESGIASDRGAVLAPFHRVEEMARVDADIRLLDQLTDGARNFLMVGRVAPNKGHLDLVESFSAYARSSSEPARLILLGKSDPRLGRYTDSIRARIDELGLNESVLWLNGASEAQLKAAYLSSHVFMLLSEHEGFCVPLVESMAIGTPIVARATSAVPETLADAGIVWEDADPWLFAASAARIFNDGELRSELRECARNRYQTEFSNPVLRTRFLSHLEPAL